MTDETNQASETPDGATPPADTVPRSELEQAIKRRDSATARARELEARIAVLESPPGATETPAAPPPDTSGSPSELREFMASVNQRFEGLDQKLTGAEVGRARGDAQKAVLDKVPDGNREDAKTFLRGLEADGLDLTQPGAVDTALSKLPNSVLHDASRPSPRRAPQRGPDGSLDFAQFKHPDDIPPEFRAAAFKDKATMDRMMGSVGQGSTRESDGFNI